MRYGRIFVLLAAILVALPEAQAQDHDLSDEEYASERIHQIAKSLAIGQRSVAEHDSLISLHAAKYEIDPDWLRAIMVVEYMRLPEEIGDRIAPMGIDAVTWAGLDDATVETFSTPSENIRLAALLLQRIVERLPEGNQSLYVAASLYDDIGATSVTQYGMKVGQAYEQRWWINKNSTDPNQQ